MDLGKIAVPIIFLLMAAYIIIFMSSPTFVARLIAGGVLGILGLIMLKSVLKK